MLELLSQLKQLRKSIAFLIFLALLLTVKKVSQSIWIETDGQEDITELQDSKKAPNFILCKKVLNNRPLGQISHETTAGKRLFLFHPNSEAETLYHHWYHEGESVIQFKCSASEKFCISSISPSQAVIGNWSVDVIADNILIESRQFELIHE